MLMIFLLLVKSFHMSVHISQLETKLKELVQRIALDDNELEQVLKKEAKKDEKQQEGQKTEE